MANANQIKVINESPQRHYVDNIRKEAVKIDGKAEIVEHKLFSKPYVFEPMEEEGNPTVTMVEKEDFDVMINPDNFREAKIYTKEQWKQRLALEKEQKEAWNKFWKLPAAEQSQLMEEMYPSQEDRYLLLNILPHEA